MTTGDDADSLIRLVKFSIQLPEGYSQKLSLWARCTGKYRAAMASDILKARIEANRDLIRSLVEEVAAEHGINVKDAEELLLKDLRS